MSRFRLFAAVAAITFVLFLLARAPAALLAQLAPGDLQINGAQGSLWSGQANSVRLGQLTLGATSWKLSGSQLLLGRLAADIDTTLPGGFARGNVAIGLGGTARLSDFSAAGSISALSAATGMGFPVEDGQLSAEFSLLEISDAWPSGAVGVVRAADIAMIFRDGQPVQDQLASFELSFDMDEVPDNGVLEGLLTDRGGPLEVVGRLELSPPANYEISGRAMARPDAPREMEQALVMLGPAAPDGGREFSFAGSL